MRRWLASLLVLSACAGGGQSQPSATSAPLGGPATSSTATPPVPATSPPTAPEAPADTAPADAAPTTLVVTTTEPAVPLVVPSGLELTAARVTTADGATCDLCLWVADTVGLRSQGLMAVTDLGPADGMAFVYPAPTTRRFWMKDTVLPLSIAFFGADGLFIDSFDMEPCLAEDSSDCLWYPTPNDFVVAVETYQGGLPDIDMTPGSTLTLLDLPCQPAPDSGGGG